MSIANKIQSIYTDGACAGNPGPGGWGVVVCYSDGSQHEFGGADRETTNNRMEMQAAIAALEFLTKSQQTEAIALYTDSEYLKNGITKWIKGWKQKGWKKSDGTPVLNQDLWQLLDQINSGQVKWEYVRGHAGNVYNERCDAIARTFSLGKTPSLQELAVATPIVTEKTDPKGYQQIQYSHISTQLSSSELTMTESTAESTENFLPREVRVSQLRDLIDALHIADEVSSKGYLITSSELADLMDVNASAVTSRGDNWVWRNWLISRVRREGNQILWQLERVDHVNASSLS